MRIAKPLFLLPLALVARVALADDPSPEPTDPAVTPATEPEVTPASARRALTPADPPLVPAEDPDFLNAPKTPPEPPPTPAPPVEVVTAKPAPAPKLPAVRLGLGPHFLSRDFGWTSLGKSPFPDYSMPSAFAMAVAAEWYPGAHATQGGIADLGLFADTIFGLGIATEGFGTQWGTHAQRIRTGLRYRFATSDVEVGLHGGLVLQSWDIDATSIDGVARPKLPNVDLGAVRAGVDVRLTAGPLVFSGAASGYAAVSLGELASDRYFPQAGGGGFDLGAAIIFPFAEQFELKADVDYTRTFIGLNGPTTSPVSDAFDSTFTAGLFLACRI